VNDFDYDAMQKKRIAHGEKHRVTKTAVHFTQYTASQIKKRSGQVMTYTMNEKHTMKELRGWADDMRKRYLQVLANECGMTAEEMSRILDMSIGGVYQALKREGIKTHRGRRSEEQSEKYLAMMGLGKEEPEEAEAPVLTVPQDGRITFEGSFAVGLETAMALIGQGGGRLYISWEAKDNG
jgi:hypothetical protein